MWRNRQVELEGARGGAFADRLVPVRSQGNKEDRPQ